MGPYCNYCNTRCFCHFPQGTPEAALKAYRPGVSIIASCRKGQEFEKETTGWCLDLILEALEKNAG
jgi:hypothetical protein